MAPLTIPQRPQGGHGPLFGLSPGERGGSAERLRRRRELELFRATAGQGASLLPVLGWKLVLRVGSFGENVGAALFFELGALLAPVLRQRLANLECYSGEQGRRSSFWERTFVCN